MLIPWSDESPMRLKKKKSPIMTPRSHFLFAYIESKNHGEEKSNRTMGRKPLLTVAYVINLNAVLATFKLHQMFLSNRTYTRI